MLTIHVWPRWLKAFLLAHDLYKSPRRQIFAEGIFETHGADQVPTAAVLPRIPDQPGLDKAAEDLLSFTYVLQK